MNASGRPAAGLTRRVLLPGLTALGVRAWAAERPRLPSEWFTYLDAATEFPVTRLTSPQFASGICPGAWTRPAGSLLYWSQRTGAAQVFRMDLKTGASEQLTSAESLDPLRTVVLPAERGFCYFDGEWLFHAEPARARQRRVYSAAGGWTPASGLGAAPDGRRIVFVERRGGAYRLRLVRLDGGAVSTVLESGAAMDGPAVRGRPAEVLFRQGDDLWLAGLNGRNLRRLGTAPGAVGGYCWSPDQAAVLYLHLPADRRALHSIRSVRPEGGADELVAPTSQFAAFSPNRDATVFAGASGSRASPYLLLLVRATRRELALCEHRASDAAATAPVFSSDSQQVFFHSDRDGGRAIYRMQVDRLVEKTDT